MPTFPRGFVNYQTNLDNAAMLEQVSRETGGNVAVETTKHRFYATAGDGRTLRGIPAIGISVTGAINGTIPHVHGV